MEFLHSCSGVSCCPLSEASGPLSSQYCVRPRGTAGEHGRLGLCVFGPAVTAMSRDEGRDEGCAEDPGALVGSWACLAEPGKVFWSRVEP